MFTSLLKIYNSRSDLQKAFPQKGTALDDWWNKHGVKEYPGVTLVQPGDKRIQAPINLTAEAQKRGKVDDRGVDEGQGKGKDERGDTVDDSEYYEQLNEDKKSIVDYFKQILEDNDKAKQEAFDKALDLAAEQADPYFRQKIRILKDTVQRTFGTLEADLASREKELTRRRQEIDDDLIYNKEQLTIDEQAEMKRQQESYGFELDGIRETMSHRGLTVSTIKTKAEERLKTGHEDIIESTQRKYERAQRAQGLGAERQITGIIQQIADLQRGVKEKKTEVGRGTEAYLGTEEALKIPELTGYTAGGIKGGIEEEKAGDILQRAQALLLQGMS